MVTEFHEVIEAERRADEAAADGLARAGIAGSDINFAAIALAQMVQAVRLEIRAQGMRIEHALGVAS